MPHPNSAAAAALYQGQADGTQKGSSKGPQVASVSFTMAAGGVTDAWDTTIQIKDVDGNNLARKVVLEAWISEAADGDGLTGDSASGALTAVSTFGTILTALTAKKHVTFMTNASGQAKLRLVDSANPTDQYWAVKLPNGEVQVSGASGTNWEGV